MSTVTGLGTSRLVNRTANPICALMSTTPWSSVYFDASATRAQRIARMDALATLLDTAFVIPGTNIRFGIDALIGLVPGIGDVITTALSLFIVREAHAVGAPKHLVARMLVNVAFDGALGLVPLVGDAFDVAWRANRRNVDMLRRWLADNDHSLAGRRP